MADERFIQAIARVEAAIARIEAAIRALPADAPRVPDLATVDLLERHTRLKIGAADALTRLDRLIASQGE